MHLWTEYEGNTLAGYPLGRLVRSEGRSAFFLTSTPEGDPAMVRLTESHFDESELVTRWQKVAAVSHPHLQAIKHFGQTVFDGVPLACCLLEQTDASLSDVLRERALTTDETKEVAEAVAGALAALHAAGLVHEHVDASNVFAMGEIIKLRSDCVRECTGDFEADTTEAREALRQRDVKDLGLLLLRCLTMDWQGTTSMPLPAPFDRIIPNALEGKGNAQTIVDALNALKPAPPISRPLVAPQATPEVSAASTPEAVMAALAKESPRELPTATRYASMPAAVARPIAKPASDDPFDVGLGSLRNESRSAKLPADSILRRLTPMRPQKISRNALIGASAAAAMLALVLWNTVGGSKTEAKESPAPIVEGTPAKQSATTTTAQPKPAPVSASSLLTSMRGQPGWHVIAYTYNYEQQAQAKAVALQQRYLDLHPQVFTPTGRAPYFVALGGPSDAASATALRNRARHVGLPRDTYARNF